MPDLVIFVANQGAEISDCKKEDMFLELFYDGSKGTKFKKISRPNGDVHYIFLKYADEKKHFISYSERSGCFFGMSLILSKEEQTKYNPNIDTMCKLMCKVYNDHVKDKIIQHFPNGNLKYMIPTLAPKDDSVAKKLAEKMYQTIKNTPELNVFSNSHSNNNSRQLNINQNSYVERR